MAEMFAVPSTPPGMLAMSQPPFELMPTPGRCVKKKFVPGRNSTLASPCSLLRGSRMRGTAAVGES